MEYLAKFKESIYTGEKIPLQWPANLERDYIKMVTNIYNINLRKFQKRYYDEYVKKGKEVNSEQRTKIINDIYKMFLKESRIQVLNFFKFQSPKEVSNKSGIRLFIYNFSPYHPLRIKYNEISEEVNEIMKKVQIEGIIEELYDDNHPKAITTVVDVKFL